MQKRAKLAACLKLMRESDDLEGIQKLLSGANPEDVRHLASTTLRETEARLAFGQATPAEVRAERMESDTRTPDDWRRWLRNSRSIFNGDPVRIAQQYAFLAESGKSAVYFAMTPEERKALAEHQRERRREINLAIAKAAM